MRVVDVNSYAIDQLGSSGLTWTSMQQSAMSTIRSPRMIEFTKILYLCSLEIPSFRLLLCRAPVMPNRHSLGPGPPGETALSTRVSRKYLKLEHQQSRSVALYKSIVGCRTAHG